MRFSDSDKIIEVTSARKVLNKDKLADVIANEIDIVRKAFTCFEDKKTRSSEKLLSIDNPWHNGLQTESNQEYVSSLYFISVSQQYYVFNRNRDIDSYPGVNKLTGASKEIVDNLKGFIGSSVSQGLLYQGKYVTLVYNDFGKITAIISFSEKHPYVLQLRKQFNGITDAALVKMVNNNLLSYANSSNFMTFPSLYNEDFVVKPLRQPKLLMGQDGFVIEIPRVTKANYEAFVEATVKGAAIHNAIISVDDKVKAVVYLDENTQQQIFSYNGATVILNKNKTNWLNRPVTSLYDPSGVQNLGAIYDWAYYFRDLWNKYQDYLLYVAPGQLNTKVADELNLPSNDELRKDKGQATVGDLITADAHKFVEFIEDLKKASKERFDLGGVNNAWKVPLYLRFTGLLSFLKGIAEEGAVGIKAGVLKEKMAFNNAKASDMPAVPNMDPEIALFPHQAETLAKLEISQQSAIIDISTGGGKCAKFNQLIQTLTGIYTLQELFELGKLRKAKKDATEWFSDLGNIEVYSTEGLASSSWAYRRVAGEPTIGWKFTDGSYVEGLKEHKLKVFNPETRKLDWKRLDEIKRGDWLPKTCGLKLFGNNRNNIEYNFSSSIPLSIRTAPEDVQLGFLSRLEAQFTRNEFYSYTSEYREVIFQLKAILENLNILCTVAYSDKNIYTLTIDPSSVLNWTRLLDLDVSGLNTTDTRFSIPNNVEPIDGQYFVQAEEQFTGNEEYVYDISVPGPHSYLLDGFMSHNTISILTDILNLMNQKKVKRPLILMPTALIGQWISQIGNFTGGTVNAFAITTDIVKSRATKDKSGYEVLAETIANLPPNTIFLTSIDFIKTGKELVFAAPSPKDNIYSYGGVDWIKEVIDPDIISVDEAHKIKNPTTDVCKATYALGDGVEYKRIATGTLINNNPDDLIGQVGFLDPNIIGNTAEFKSRYYERSSRGGRTKYTKPVDNFAELVRNDLRNNTNYIIYRKKDWASLLPKVEYTQEFVELNSAQQAVYNDMVHEMLEEIYNDPALADVIKNLTSEDGDVEDDMELPAWILGRLAKLEQYLTAPEMHNLVAKLGKDAISVKLPKIDELIGESIKQGYKVIVAVHYKEAARHLIKYSKYGRNSLYYDASKKDLIAEFKNNKNIHALFAVALSLREGLNLQCANRIIIADVDWTPGGLEQLEARIFRPSLEIKDGKIINKNEGKTVYINTVLANYSADVVKYVFQNFKRIRNSIIMENCPVPKIRKPGFDEASLTGSWGDMILGGMDTVQGIKDFRDWQKSEIDKERDKHREFVPIKAAPKLPGKTIHTPWVPGMDLPLEDGEVPMSEYLEQFPEFVSTRDLHTVEDKLQGQVVKTEFGYGVVKEVNKRSKTKLRVRLFNGQILSAYPVVLTVLVPDADGKKIKELEKKANGGGSGRKRPQPIGSGGGRSDSDSGDATSSDNTTTGKPRVATTAPRTRTTTDESTDQSQDALPTGEVTRKKLNELAEPFGLVLKKKTKKDGVHWYWKPLERDDIALRIQNVEELTDKSWKRWIKNLKAAEKAFEEFYAEEAEGGDDATQQSIAKDKKRREKQQSEEQRDYKIELHVGTYNSIPMLIAYPSDPDSKDLVDIGFKLFPETWTVHIPNKNYGYAVLEKLQSKFNVPENNVAEIEDVLDGMSRSKYGHDFPEDAKNFMKLVKKKAKDGNLKVYPLIIDERVYFVVDKNSHPGVNLTRYKFGKNKFEEESSFYGYLAKSTADLKKKLKQVSKILEITNIKSLTKEAKDLFGISLSGKE